MTNTLKVRAELTDLGIFNKTFSFPRPFSFPKPGQVKLRISKVQVSNRIPNVYDARPLGINFNNTTLRVGTNTTPYQVIKLEPGMYLGPWDFEMAINAALNKLFWWNDPKIPGLEILRNPIVDKYTIKIDSTKLNPFYGTQFYLDLQESTTGSTLWKTLGFTSTSIFTTDNSYDAPFYPVTATQGTSCLVCSSVVPSRLYNQDCRPYAADVDISYTYDVGDYIWPTGNVGNDRLIYEGSRTLNEVTLYAVTSSGAPMVFLRGELTLEVLLYQ